MVANPHEGMQFECTECFAQVVYPDDYVTIRSMHTRPDVLMTEALVFNCPGCGERHYKCPVCSNDDQPKGWFWGEQSNQKIACHCCNYQEYRRQERAP